MFAPEEAKIINLLPPKDISSSAQATAYVSMAKYDHLTLLVTTGATGAIGNSIAVTCKQAASTSGSSSAAIPIKYYWKNSAALASASIANDTYVKTTVASSAATFMVTPSTNNVTYVLEFDGAELTDGLSAVGIGVGATAAATICGCTAILTNSRYKQSAPPSAL